jgi:hypothetical protein
LEIFLERNLGGFVVETRRGRRGDFAVLFNVVVKRKKRRKR